MLHHQEYVPPPVAEYMDKLSRELHERTSETFAIYRSDTGELAHLPAGTEGFPAILLDIDSSQRAAVHAELPGRYQINIPVTCEQKPFIAVGFMDGTAHPADESAVEKEQVRLKLWAESLAAQLKTEEPDPHAETELAWRSLLAMDTVLRRIRLSRTPARNLSRVLQACSELVSTDLLAMNPRDEKTPVVTHGDLNILPREIRQLVNAIRGDSDFFCGKPYFCESVNTKGWGQGQDNIRNLMFLETRCHESQGWLLAINKTGGERFRRQDAAVLMPFLSAAEMYGKALTRYDEIKDLLVALTRALTAALDAKDPHTQGHSERVARIAVEIGKSMEMDQVELGDLYLIGLLHDVGKIGVQDSVLRKPEPLTAGEYEHVKEHVTLGYSILSDLHSIRDLLPGVLYHHENFDGTGYPDGLAGEEIPITARILAVADAYEAMTSPRPYRSALTINEAELRLRKGSGKQWDPKVVEALLRARLTVRMISPRGVGDSLSVAVEAAIHGSNNLTDSSVILSS